MASTAAIARQLDDAIIEDFADLYVMEDTCKAIESAHDLDDPAVIAALATYADVGPVQKRLIARPAKALATGLAKPPKLRSTAQVLVDVLRAAAERELVAGPPPQTKKKRPAFAVPQRLPVLMRGKTALSIAETEALLDQLQAGQLAGTSIDTDSFTPASRAAFGRALVFGWIVHTGDPKARWAATAASQFLDDAGAQAVATFAREIASRIGQSAKAVTLVEVVGAVPSAGAVAALEELASRTTAKAIQSAAQAAIQRAAKRHDVSAHELADRVMTDSPTHRSAFIGRLRERMLAGTPISMRELVESILQNPIARDLATNVIFSSDKGTFTIANDRLEDVKGKPFSPEGDVLVAYPGDLSAAELAAWTKRKLAQPFHQLARIVPPIHHLASLQSFGRRVVHYKLSASELFALEPLGWTRGPVKAGKCTSLVRELGGVTAAIHLRPGFGARTAANQRITAVRIDGTKPTVVALRQIARELELIGPAHMLNWPPFT